MSQSRARAHEAITSGIQSALGTLTANTTGKLDILGHNSDPLGMDGTQIGILEKTDQISLRSLLQSKDGGALEAKIRLVILSNLTNQTLEGQLADKELCGLLELADFTESNGTRFEAMRLLDSASGGRGFAGCFRGQLLAGGFATGGLTSGLLGTSHCERTVDGLLGRLFERLKMRECGEVCGRRVIASRGCFTEAYIREEDVLASGDELDKARRRSALLQVGEVQTAKARETS